ncbi:expressed unknown protein [Seminavis robusta]|uniref:Uncharacterized protein n=1 Tax=Seminavis robusta TaxID=568900 RepID=A0A9N8EQD5_9STRA|nr:expressed unknown protein [Seminavis robusta]|eukprot:Sro1390_g268640.1 n/a (536) ;mRNA; f:12104-13711
MENQIIAVNDQVKLLRAVLLRFVESAAPLVFIREACKTNNDLVTHEILLRACKGGAAPGAVAFLANEMPELVQQEDSEGLLPINHLVMCAQVDEDDVKALVDIFPKGITHKEENDRISPLNHIIATFSAKMILYCFQKFPREEVKLTLILLSQATVASLGSLRQVLRTGIDCGCMTGISLLLDRQQIKTILISNLFAWEEGIYAQFLSRIVCNAAVEALGMSNMASTPSNLASTPRNLETVMNVARSGTCALKVLFLDQLTWWNLLEVVPCMHHLQFLGIIGDTSGDCYQAYSPLLCRVFEDINCRIILLEIEDRPGSLEVMLPLLRSFQRHNVLKSFTFEVLSKENESSEDFEAVCVAHLANLPHDLAALLKEGKNMTLQEVSFTPSPHAGLTPVTDLHALITLNACGRCLNPTIHQFVKLLIRVSSKRISEDQIRWDDPVNFTWEARCRAMGQKKDPLKFDSDAAETQREEIVAGMNGARHVNAYYHCIHESLQCDGLGLLQQLRDYASADLRRSCLQMDVARRPAATEVDCL